MKKFFALVLALVMALSLTTVAWGAQTHTIDSQSDWDTMLSSLAAGDTIVLNVSVELAAEVDLPANVTLEGNNKTISIVGTTWPATVPGKHMMHIGANNAIKNVTFDSKGAAYGLQAYCVTGVKLENVSIINSAGAGLTVNGATVEAVDLKASGNAWGSVNVDPGSGVTTVSKFTISGDNTKLSDATTIYGETPAPGDPAIEVAINGGTYAGDIDIPAAAGTAVISGGTFSTAPTVPTGYTVVQNTAGEYVVTAATLLGEKFDLYLANAQLNANLKAGTPTVSGIILTEVPAQTFTNGSGNVAYVKGNNGEFYVKTTTPYTSSYAVTAADKTTVLYYVDAAGNDAGAFTYTAKATEFNNFSLVAKCGYVTGKPTVGATYFQLADGTVYMAADASATEANNYLVGDTVYSKGAPQAVVKHTFKANNYKYDAAAGKYIPTSAICTTCLTTSTAIYEDAKVPAGVFSYDLAAPDAAYQVVVGSASAPAVGGATTDKVVESAQTFDAGIAMYVGMSVMAAAGSVVVFKKRED